jgi:hypothetical protein
MKKQHVDFPIAKLLKEKGFNEDCSSVYNHRAELLENYALINQHLTEYLPEKESEFLLIPRNSNDGNLYIDKIDFNSWEGYYSAPEIWEVVEWLRVEKGIWVSVRRYIIPNDKFLFEIRGETTSIESKEQFNSPKEAYLASFKHILEELI